MRSDSQLSVKFSAVNHQTSMLVHLVTRTRTLEVRSSLVHKLASSEMSRVTRNGFDRLRASCAMAERHFIAVIDVEVLR